MIRCFRGVDYSLLLWPNGMNTLGELLSLCIIWQLALHPNSIGIWCISNGSVDSTLATALESVVALTGSWAVPIPWDIHPSDALCDGSCLGVALALDIFEELRDQLLLIDVYARVDGVHDGLVVELETSLCGPCIFDGLKFCTVLASSLSGNHEVVKGLKIGVCRAEDVGMVAGIDGCGDECGSFSISSSNREEIGSFNNDVSNPYLCCFGNQAYP